MAKEMTLDQAFFVATVRGDQKAVAKIVKMAEREQGKECPDCGGTDIMDNGETQVRYLTFACRGCGQQWDAVKDLVR